MKGPRFSAGDPLAGLPLRRALLIAAVAAVVLPLLVMTTALTGFAAVERSHAMSYRLLTAQQYQQDADLMYATIHSDVLESLEGFEGNNETGEQLAVRTRSHVARLEDDLRRLTAMKLTPAVAERVRALDAPLRAYAAEAVRLTDLATVSPVRAREEHPAFDAAFDDLTQRQATLTAAFATEAGAAHRAADARQETAIRWTSIIAAATLGALLVLALALYRVGVGNEVLLRRVEENAERLAFSNDELQDAQQLAHIGSWQWELATGKTQWSAEFYRILGVDPDTKGNHAELFTARVHPDDAADVVRAQDQAAATPGDVHSEYRIVRPDGAVRDVRAMGRAVRDDSGTVVRLVGTVQDITDQREVERMKDEFVAVISHELRTPLTSIRGALGLMAGGAVGTLPPKAQRMADVALNSSQRLVRLINDILDVEKMSAGKLELDVVHLPAAEVVGAAIEEMRAMADGAGVTLVATPMDSVVLADRDRVAQTLTNLLSNAVKFSPEGGTVTVSAGPARSEPDGVDAVLFTVTDQGAGIASDKLESVFDRFAQADASDTRAKGGTGLGLPICRAIVEQHGGRIWATSSPGQGTTFSFTLPPVPAPSADITTGTLPTGAILICDDDPDTVEVLAAMVEAHGYRTLRAHSGPEALSLAARHTPSVVLMDLRMPGMSGWETIAALGADPATTDIPIVILSALAPDDIAVPAASSWLTKPIDQGALMGSLRHALGKGSTTSVVVVEDDEALGEVLLAFFSEQGVHARVAHTGAQALAMIRAVPPDLLVLDLGLPDIDGYQVVEELRRDERLRSLPLLVYTGSQLDAADRSRLRLGETRFATKAEGGPTDFEDQVVSLLRTITAPTPL
ncbi:hybrid sensor histidine kinase/response regulator [Pedococcus sp. P5_B7]